MSNNFTENIIDVFFYDKLSKILIAKLLTRLQCRMVCTFALHISQYDNNMPSSMIDWMILV